MVLSQFGMILKEFESFFGCPLTPDANHSCLIKMNQGLAIQMELDHRSHLLLIGCRVGLLHTGRYRQQVIRQALKFNAVTAPSEGVLGFSHGSNHLILFIKVDPATLTLHDIPPLLAPFIAKAKAWSEAIGRGELPPIQAVASPLPAPGLFGLITPSKG